MISFNFVPLFCLILCFLSFKNSEARELPHWNEGHVITEARSNPYQLSPIEFEHATLAGKIHTLEYPVEITGALMPFEPIQKLLDPKSPNILYRVIQNTFGKLTKVQNLDQLYARMGLHSFNTNDQDWPLPKKYQNSDRMGLTHISRTLNGKTIEGITVSCAACHVSNLFGRKIIGLSNRFPRSNEIFVLGKKGTELIHSSIFKLTTQASDEEKQLYLNLKNNMKYVTAKKPQALGLDTSLSQVALSLSKRALDPYASKTAQSYQNPRKDLLDQLRADSKPAVWWNLKYKTKWLADGSVVSGNPIFTNFIWNEIGRGSDLKELELWLKQNEQVIEELTTAVFSTEAPRITDFFEASRFDLNKAKKGEIHFQTMCSKCHGDYEKNWSLKEFKNAPLIEQLKTSKVNYHFGKETPVINVGTDPGRALGMKSLEKSLNPLKISQNNQIKIVAQNGYVPPPLVGIWARYPYFHNNSIPNLCAVISPTKFRPKQFYTGEALDPVKDYDFECGGYPLGDHTPREWKKYKEHLFNTKLEGLDNSGHEKMLIKEGKEILSTTDKAELIEFLKTL